nr:putative ribonuclease h protein [Quercus suber]
MFENGMPNPKLDKFYLGQAREFHFCVSKINQVSSKTLIPVRWNKPSIGWHKLNTDGASIGNSGKVGNRGVIRDCHGVWVKGYSRSIGYTTSVLAEWWALWDGLILAIQLGINQVEVELDAKVIVVLLNGAKYPNWSYSPLLNDYSAFPKVPELASLVVASVVLVLPDDDLRAKRTNSAAFGFKVVTLLRLLNFVVLA